MRILIVEDEKEINQTVSLGFEKSGFIVDSSFDGKDAIDKILSCNYDVIVLDLNLPFIDGIEVCREARKNKVNTPIIMLTARDKINDKIEGLDSGADDYLVKPFNFRELKARVNAILRRQYNCNIDEVEIGKLKVNFNTRTAFYDEKIMTLTKKEFDILYYLSVSFPNVCSLEDILEHCFDEFADPFTNTVRVHLSSLRRKLKKECGVDLIENKKGEGYIIIQIKID